MTRDRLTIDLRLAVPAAVTWLVAAVVIGIPQWSVGVGVTLWSLACLFATFAAVRARPPRADPQRRGKRASRAVSLLPLAAVCCAVAAMMASVVGVNAPQRLPNVVRAAAERHDAVDAELTVVSAPESATSIGSAGAAGIDRIRFRATLSDLGVGELSVPVVVFAERPKAAELRVGTTVRLAGTLRLTDPGDAASALLFGRGPPQVVHDPPGWLAFFGDLRARFTNAASALPGDGGDLLPGLAIGDTAAVTAPLDTAMKTSSLSHLTAVSGANCAIVIAAVMVLGGYLRLRRPWRIALSLLALLAFVVLVTPEPSVLRSSVMATLTLLALGVGRPGLGVPTLSLSVIVLLGLDPWLARNYGFALSVLATGGLLLLSGPLARVLSRWMPVPLAAVIAIPVAAQLACQPVLVLLAPTLPLYGVPANLLAAPAAPVATVVGLLACLLLPVLPPVGTGLMYLAWLPSGWIAAVAQTTAALPLTTLPWLGGLPGFFAIAAVTALALALLLTGSGQERIPAAAVTQPSAPQGLLRRTIPSRCATPHRCSPRSLWRMVALALLIVGFGLYAGTLIGAGVGRALALPRDWQIAACDIGQGDAVVVRNVDPFGVSRFALIDVGPDPALLHACLETLGIDRISLLLLTHYDLDHIGGIDTVIGRVDVALVGEPENRQDEALHTRLTGGGATVQQAARGDTGTLGDLHWQIYWPVRDSTLMQMGNDGSVTMGFDGRGIRSIFLGDLGEDSQEALRAEGVLPAVDVVKVAHHGSGDQSAEFYADLHARVGVISVGADNGYGHPTASLLDLLAASGTDVLRTDRQGMVVIAPAAAGGLSIWTENTEDIPAVAAASAEVALPTLPARVPVRLVRAHRRLESRGRSTRRTSRGADRVEICRETRRQSIGQNDHRPARLASGSARTHRARLRHRIFSGRTRHPSAAGLSETRRPEPGD